jgi:hypothetical protein
MANATIAGMLADSGASIGSTIGGGIAGLGKAAGGMLQSRADAKNKAEQQSAIEKELQQYANDPAQLNAMGQKYQSQGRADVAKAFYEAAKQASAKVDKKTAATTGRGKGELMALANNPKFDITNQKMQSGYFGMADSFGVSREEAMQIAIDAKKGRDGTGKVTSSRGAGTYRDEDGNLYELGIVRTDAGERKNWTPISPGAPATPSGKLTAVGGSYKESAAEKTERDVDTAGGTTEAEQYAELRIEAVDSLPEIESTILSTERSLQVLDTIRTGGWSTAAVRAASRFLGVEPKSEAEFNLLAGQQVLAGLSNFEGAISEGERNYLQSLYQDLTRSNGANRGILELMLDTANRALRDAETRANSGTFQEYMENREDYRAPMGQRPRTVNFNDLPRGS